MKKLALLLLIALLLAGCKGRRGPGENSAAVSLGNFPIGSYANTISAWTWDFRSDGTFTSGGVQAGERGTFTVAGDQISLKGDYCGEIVGTYTWSHAETGLTFEAIDDKCTDRAGVVVNGKWTRRP